MEKIVEKRRGNSKNRRLLFTVVFLVALSFWVGINVGYVKNREVASFAILANNSVLPPEAVDFGPFWKVWNVLNERFVSATTTDFISNEELLWGAISGLADAYGDPYTVFFPPAEAETFKEEINGSFGGVGIEIGIRDGSLTVIAPLKGSPAELAGMKAGDRIIEVDGKFVENISIDKAVQKIRGEIGTKVVLNIARKNIDGLISIEVVRDTIKIPTLDAKLREDGVFVISLYNFSAPSSGLFGEAIREFEASESNKLIIDLRNNPGGFLEASVEIASWFLPSGKIVVSEDFGGEQSGVDHRTRGSQVISKKFKTVVLVNEGSASASEILAGALKEHGVAIVIGKSTFGKGSVQELVPITSDTSLKVTIARWLTPNGNSISNGGLDPDIEVEITEEEFLDGKDPQLDRAVQFLIEDN